MDTLDQWAAALAGLDVKYFHALDDTEKLFYRIEAAKILERGTDSTSTSDNSSGRDAPPGRQR